jgi:hypothetical protein
LPPAALLISAQRSTPSAANRTGLVSVKAFNSMTDYNLAGSGSTQAQKKYESVRAIDLVSITLTEKIIR